MFNFTKITSLLHNIQQIPQITSNNYQIPQEEYNDQGEILFNRHSKK